MSPHARLGVVVAKRYAPRSVTRNMIKRICREVFRKNEIKTIDCIVRLSSPLNKRGEPATGKVLKQQVRAEIENLFARNIKKGAG